MLVHWIGAHPSTHTHNSNTVNIQNIIFHITFPHRKEIAFVCRLPKYFFLLNKLAEYFHLTGFLMFYKMDCLAVWNFQNFFGFFFSIIFTISSLRSYVPIVSFCCFHFDWCRVLCIHTLQNTWLTYCRRFVFIIFFSLCFWVPFNSLLKDSRQKRNFCRKILFPHSICSFNLLSMPYQKK